MRKHGRKSQFLSTISIFKSLTILKSLELDSLTRLSITKAVSSVHLTAVHGKLLQGRGKHVGRFSMRYFNHNIGDVEYTLFCDDAVSGDYCEAVYEDDY